MAAIGDVFMSGKMGQGAGKKRRWIWFAIIPVIILGVLGISSILLTASVYLAVYLLLSSLPVRSLKNRENLRLFVLFTLLSLFSAELFLKYVQRSHLTYAEQNGAFFYVSEYKQYRLQNWARKWLFSDEEPQVTRHRPHSMETIGNSEFSFAHQYNSLGLRGPEPMPGKDGQLRILALGDSFTEGVGAAEENTWPAALERQLSGRPVSQQAPVVVNGGVNSTDPFAEFWLFKKVLQPYEPHIILLAVNSTDITDYIWRGGLERFHKGQLRYRSGPRWEFVYQFSYLFRAFIHNIAGKNWMLLSDDEVKELEREAYEALTRLIIDEFLPLTSTSSSKLVVFLHPTLQEIHTGHPELQEWLASISETTPQLSTIDLIADFQDYFDRNEQRAAEYYWPIDRHHNARGYQLLAERLAQHPNFRAVQESFSQH